MANDAPNPVMPESNHLVRHNLRAKANDGLASIIGLSGNPS
jgi:hypothetical protein